MVSYFYKQRGCQYPWNVHKSLDVPTCLNYSKTVRTLRIRDPKKGFGNEWFGQLERRARTNKECLASCFIINYDMEYIYLYCFLFFNWQVKNTSFVNFFNHITYYKHLNEFPHFNYRNIQTYNIYYLYILRFLYIYHYNLLGNF